MTEKKENKDDDTNDKKVIEGMSKKEIRKCHKNDISKFLIKKGIYISIFINICLCLVHNNRKKWIWFKNSIGM